MLGIGAVALAGSYCFAGCNPQDAITAPTNVDFTLDLTNPSYSVLMNNGGYVYNGGVVVARTITGAYVAVSQACTHQGATVQYNAGANQFHCSNHGANFATDGSVVNGPAGSPLARYNTTLNGSSLRVFS